MLKNKVEAAKSVCLVSGGIDSIVAVYLMAQRGLQPILVYINNWPLSTIEIQQKVRLLANRLSKVLGKPITLYEIPQGPLLSEIIARCQRNYTCVLCRRMMYRLAAQIAENEEAVGIVTGESLGQVASQTLSNLAVETDAVTVPILRPLIGFDKEEIVQLARKIGTFEISILPGHCCSAVPKRPTIQADLNIVIQEELKLDLKRLVDQAIQHGTKTTVQAE